MPLSDPTTAAEPCLDVAHMGHLELLTPKLEESRSFFVDLLGMEAVHEEGASVYLRGYGDYATTTLKLTGSETSGIGHVAWRCASEAALERRVAAIEATGLGEGWSNGDFGHGRAYCFTDPDGHRMEVYYEEQKYDAPPELTSNLKNLPMKYTGRGIGVRRTDHCAMLCRDVAANRDFASNVLGLNLREQVVYENGTRDIGAWMSSCNVHHELAYVIDTRGGAGRLHHVSFWVDEREEVLRAADILMDAGVRVETGPSKHNNSQAFYIYVFEPGGNRIEIYTSGLFVFAPDFETVTWDEASRGTGVYWGGALPDSFLNYATPPLDDAGTPEFVEPFDIH